MDVYPDTNHTNAIYGSTRIGNVSSNIYFSNAKDDPWQWAAVRNSSDIS